MRERFHLFLGRLKDKNKDVNQYMEWQRNVIRSECVDGKGAIQTEKEIQDKGRDSIE